MKAKGEEIERLTIGPPDFDASFSTVPDFDVIHDRVGSSSSPQQVHRAPPQPVLTTPSCSLRDRGRRQRAAAAGRPLGLPATSPAQQTPPPSSDFTPVTTTPDGEPITEEMLNQLKREGNEQAIRELVATNGQCAPL